MVKTEGERQIGADAVAVTKVAVITDPSSLHSKPDTARSGRSQCQSSTYFKSTLHSNPKETQTTRQSPQLAASAELKAKPRTKRFFYLIDSGLIGFGVEHREEI
jgi:hypothetical protein